MNKPSFFLLAIVSVFFVASAVCEPQIVLGNKLLLSFVHDQMINIVAILVTITTASAAQLHLTLNEIEKGEGKTIFSRTRKEIKDNVLVIVIVFIAEIFFLVLLDWLEGARGQCVVIGLMIVSLILAILLMYDIVGSIFKIPAFPKPVAE
jgi:hypothetical protein